MFYLTNVIQLHQSCFSIIINQDFYIFNCTCKIFTIFGFPISMNVLTKTHIYLLCKCRIGYHHENINKVLNSLKYIINVITPSPFFFHIFDFLKKYSFFIIKMDTKWIILVFIHIYTLYIYSDLSYHISKYNIFGSLIYTRIKIT